ncbi:MAG: WYL domain-containing protein, partial [Clostridia bacterium]|nr:WYL domain-containing protein [Clostridia bacterium]
MIFNELYSAYYNTVAKILSAVLAGKAEEKELQRIVAEHAFGESVLTVLPALKNEKWQLVHGDGTTPLRYPPTMPLTRIQKQWLKAITLDPRFRLFGVEIAGLEEVEPLFTAADYSVYDRYSDGDPYEDAGYIDRFQTILSALQTGQGLKLEMVNRRGKTVYAHCIPKRLEYSEKDDKFRLVTAGCPFVHTVNLARITK